MNPVSTQTKRFFVILEPGTEVGVIGPKTHSLAEVEAAKYIEATDAREAAEKFPTSVLGLRHGITVRVFDAANGFQRLYYREYANKGNGDAFTVGGMPSDPVTIERPCSP